MSGCGHVYNCSSPEPILLGMQGVCVPVPGLGTEHGHASDPHSEADLYWHCTAELCQATGRQRWTARSRRDSVILLHTFTPPPPLLPLHTLTGTRGQLVPTLVSHLISHMDHRMLRTQYNPDDRGNQEVVHCTGQLLSCLSDSNMERLVTPALLPWAH